MKKARRPTLGDVIVSELCDEQVRAVIAMLDEQLADGEWHAFGPLFAKSGSRLTPEMSVRVWLSQQIGRRALSTPIPTRVDEGRQLIVHGLLARVAEYQERTEGDAFSREYRQRPRTMA
jgi:hypothetical protein